MDLTNLSRAVSHALRHEPWLYELELDEAGWVPVETLLLSLRFQNQSWVSLTRNDLEEMIARSDKKRHELDGDRIRALYGHSTPQRLLRIYVEPPEILYHGTSPETAEQIRNEGLRPMGRQYVHLSVDTATADQVGQRKANSPVILLIKAAEAHCSGICFYRGNNLVWLADAIPPTFIRDIPNAED
ncbi:RNA 2'-phosphotransferase [Brucella pseudogrignonensis]|uniref:RNA 2'-phosphotransferase n=1 Tax=Brucella pseudogrignonensis TaxID=419475 RepID=UPI0038D15EA9